MKRTMVGAKCSHSFEIVSDNFHNVLRLVIVCVFAMMFGSVVHGQARGSFSGNVLDKSGAGIPGASVIATSQGTGMARDTKTDTTGHYVIPLLPVGTYTLRVDATGFQSAESKDVHLQVDEARELDFSIVPATVVTTVAVTGDAVAIETANPSFGQVITSQQVSQLPLNGRDFVQLATLTAGATAETNPNSFFTSGQRQRGCRTWFVLAVSRRVAPQQHRLAAGRRRQQRADGGRHRRIFLDRRHSGIQGSHLHLLGRVRHPRRPHRAGHHQVGNKRLSRIALRVRSQHRLRREGRL